MKALTPLRVSLGVVVSLGALLIASSKNMTKVAADGCLTGPCAGAVYGAQCVVGGSLGCLCCNYGGCTNGYCS